jgi:hypothetical protein
VLMRASLVVVVNCSRGGRESKVAVSGDRRVKDPLSP